LTWIVVGAVVALLLALGVVLVATGSVTVDTGVGRRLRKLELPPVVMAAPREAAFDALALPYLAESPPRELRKKVRVLERGGNMVLAAHRTRVGLLTTTTVETVVLERPTAITFYLVRGPIPYAAERFDLSESDGQTEVAYSGQLGADFWWLGRAWLAVVARTWLATVSAGLESAKTSVEQRAARAERRATTA
jgi:hypothetical protein